MFKCVEANWEGPGSYKAPKIICELSGCFCKHVEWQKHEGKTGWSQTDEVKECPKFMDAEIYAKEKANEG
jgi:hypothetical protein